MKTFNIIACVIVLLLALVSAVFSYFLYEKRMQFVDGWKDMSTAIQNSARTIDGESSQKFASKLTTTTLDHTNYTNPDWRRNLGQLQAQSTHFVQQYQHAIEAWNAMAAAIQASAAIMDEPMGTDAATTTLTPEALAFSNDEFDIENYQAKFEQLTTLTRNFATVYATGWREMSETLRRNADILSKIHPAPQTDFATAGFDADKFSGQMDALEEQARAVAAEYARLQAELARTKAELESMTQRYNNEKQKYESENRLRVAAERERDDLRRQRDAMAKGMAAIGKKTGTGSGCETENDFKRTAGLDARVAQVVRKTTQIVDNRELLVTALVTVARDNGETLNKDAIFAADTAAKLNAAVAPLLRVIAKQRKARQVYAGALSQIAGALGLQFRDNLSAAETNPAQVVAKARAKVEESEQRRQQLVAAGEAKRRDEATIADQRATISGHENTISTLRRALELDGNVDAAKVKLWENGSTEARQAVVGTVTRVSAEFGYIVIDFGTETVVVQQVGKSSISWNPQLAAGLSFNITRGEDNEFIATVTLNNVGTTESTADIPPSKVGAIKVGDKVTFRE